MRYIARTALRLYGERNSEAMLLDKYWWEFDQRTKLHWSDRQSAAATNAVPDEWSRHKSATQLASQSTRSRHILTTSKSKG